MIRFIIISLSLLLTGCATSRVDELSVDYGRYIAPERAWMYPLAPEHPKESLALNMNVSPVKWFHWRNTIHATTTSAQYRYIGWQMGLMLQPLPWLEAGYLHHSQHLLDRQGQDHFPVEDQFVVKLWILGGERGGS